MQQMVRQPNGKYARFSTVTDDFTHYDMSEAEAFILLSRPPYGMGVDAAKLEIRGAREDWDELQQKGSGRDRFDYAIDVVRAVYGDDTAAERIEEMSK